MKICEWEQDDYESGVKTIRFSISCREEQYRLYKFDQFRFCPFCGGEIKYSSKLHKIINKKYLT